MRQYWMRRSFRTGDVGAQPNSADQIRATGAEICVAPCANCKKQVAEVCEDNGLDVRVCGLHDLILKAIDTPDFMRTNGSAPEGAEADDSTEDA